MALSPCTGAVGAEGSWTKSKHKDVGVTENDGSGGTYTLNKDDLVTLSGGVHGKYMIPANESKITPYALLGLGMYSVKEDFEETFTFGGMTTVETDESEGIKGETRFGGKVGAGAVYEATEQVGISLQAEYDLVTLDKDKAGESSFTFFGIRAGVNYHMPK